MPSCPSSTPSWRVMCPPATRPLTQPAHPRSWSGSQSTSSQCRCRRGSLHTIHGEGFALPFFCLYCTCFDREISVFRPSARSVYLALALGLPSLAGCTTFLARQMVQAPNKLQTPPEKQPKLAVFFDQVRNQDFSRTAMVPVGPPPADLSIA